jgi:myo-inositol-1(or 4)-monophosphatase
MEAINLITLLDQVVVEVTLAGELLVSEWKRPGGVRGYDDKADVDVEIEQKLREFTFSQSESHFEVLKSGFCHG